MSYAQALALLAERQEARWKLGLSRIEGLLAGLGDPHLGLRAVHVAGTNGKGTTCAALASILSAAGLRTGLFTSPHLVGPRERIRVDGEPIPEVEFGRLVGEAAAAEPELATYFELVTAAAFLYFRERAVDAAVVEVGMGGRLDATNVLREPLLTVISSVALDHTSYLGETPEAIAAEKAGILKPGRPCLCAVEDHAAREVVRRRAAELGAEFLEPRLAWRPISTDWERGRQRVELGGRAIELSLLGAPAARSAALAVEAAELSRAQGLPIPDAAFARGLSRLGWWPARFQLLRPEPGRALVLDGAHNPAAMEAFVATWRGSPFARPEAEFVTGVLADKDYEAMARLLAPAAPRAIVTRPDSPRALDPELFAAALRRAGCARVEVVPEPGAALARWLRGGAPTGAVCGSFYLAGRALAELERATA